MALRLAFRVVLSGCCLHNINAVKSAPSLWFNSGL